MEIDPDLVASAEVHRFAKPPFTVKEFSTGVAVILDANGYNRVSFPGGVVLLRGAKFARALALALGLELVPERAAGS